METKKAFKAFRYTTHLVWNSARRGVMASENKPDFPFGAPPEFRGHPDVWSPEDLLVASVNGCIMLTFQSLAAARKLEFTAYESTAEGVLENLDGKYRITRIQVRPVVTLQSEAALPAAQEVMSKVEENCFISNSIQSEVTLTPEFRAL